MTVITLGGATIVVLMALMIVARLVRADGRARIKWPLHIYVEERRRWMEALSQGAGANNPAPPAEILRHTGA